MTTILIAAMAGVCIGLAAAMRLDSEPCEHELTECGVCVWCGFQPEPQELGGEG